MFEKKISIYELFAEDIKNALRYTCIGMNSNVAGSQKFIEFKGLSMMKQNLNKLFDTRLKEEKHFQEKKITTYETKLKETLLNYI